MAKCEIKALLDVHAISYEVHDGRVWAESVYTKAEDDGTIFCGSQYDDVTDMSRKELLYWLGY